MTDASPETSNANLETPTDGKNAETAKLSPDQNNVTEHKPAMCDAVAAETAADTDPGDNSSLHQNDFNRIEKSKSQNDTAVTSKNKAKCNKKKNTEYESSSQLLKHCKGKGNIEEKLQILSEKYDELLNENKTLKKQRERQLNAALKQNEHLHSDLNKTVSHRNRLENLCRELQKQCKIIKEESLQRIQEEENKRKEVSTKFQATIDEVTQLMKQDSEKTSKLLGDNISMTAKLKSISEQHEIGEQQIEKMTKQMALESELHEAQMSKLKIEAEAEKQEILTENQRLLLKLAECQTKCRELQNIEETLRMQITMYSTKYDEFQTSLSRSNTIFSDFKAEMGRMSAKIAKLEGETKTWKDRWEKAQVALIDTATQKDKADKEITNYLKQIAMLQKLCRSLQTDRNHLTEQLKDLNGKEGQNGFVKNTGQKKINGVSSEDQNSKNQNKSVEHTEKKGNSRSSEVLNDKKDQNESLENTGQKEIDSSLDEALSAKEGQNKSAENTEQKGTDNGSNDVLNNKEGQNESVENVEQKGTDNKSNEVLNNKEGLNESVENTGQTETDSKSNEVLNDKEGRNVSVENTGQKETDSSSDEVLSDTKGQNKSAENIEQKGTDNVSNDVLNDKGQNKPVENIEKKGTDSVSNDVLNDKEGQNKSAENIAQKGTDNVSNDVLNDKEGQNESVENTGQKEIDINSKNTEQHITEPLDIQNVSSISVIEKNLDEAKVSTTSANEPNREILGVESVKNVPAAKGNNKLNQECENVKSTEIGNTTLDNLTVPSTVASSNTRKSKKRRRR